MKKKHSLKKISFLGIAISYCLLSISILVILINYILNLNGIVIYPKMINIFLNILTFPNFLFFELNKNIFNQFSVLDYIFELSIIINIYSIIFWILIIYCITFFHKKFLKKLQKFIQKIWQYLEHKRKIMLYCFFVTIIIGFSAIIMRWYMIEGHEYLFQVISERYPETLSEDFQLLKDVSHQILIDYEYNILVVILFSFLLFLTQIIALQFLINFGDSED